MKWPLTILTCNTHMRYSHVYASTCFHLMMLNGLMAHSHGTHGTSMWHCGISSTCRRCASSFASLARRSVDRRPNFDQTVKRRSGEIGQTCPGPSSGPSPAQLVVAAHSRFKCLESQSRHQALPTQKVQHKQFQWVTVSHSESLPAISAPMTPILYILVILSYIFYQGSTDWSSCCPAKRAACT